MKKLLAVLALLIIATVGWFLYQKTSHSSSNDILYSYQCENATRFSISVADDFSWLSLFPGENAPFPQQTLSYRDNIQGKRYQGASAEILATNAEVILGSPAGTTTCMTIEGSSSPDWDSIKTSKIERNFAVMVSESVIGTWRGTGETRFTREFKEDGTYIDFSNGTEISRGLWFVFTRDNAPDVPFVLEKNHAYFQIASENGDVAYLKIASMTLSGMIMVYLDRPGVLTFSLVE